MQKNNRTKFSASSPRRAWQGGPASGWKETEIGIIPEEWDVLDIQTVSEVVGGGTPSTADENNFNGDIPWITPRDLSSYPNRYISRGERYISEKGLGSSNAKLLPVNTVLLTTRAPVGYLAIAKNEVATNQGFHSLVSNNKTNSLFLFYLLKNNVQKLIDHASGSTFQELNGKTLKSLEFAFPKLNEQKQIAEILSSLDDKIELNRQINVNLEKNASSLFKHWFVDFEFPDKNGKPYKSSGGKMIDSELGAIPEGWKIKSLDEIADFLNGLALQKYPAENAEDYLPVIKIRELNNGVTDMTDKASIKIPKEYILENGDVVFSWSGSLDVIVWCGGRGALNQHLFKVTSSQYSKWFYYQWIKYFLPSFQKIASDKAVTMGHIKRSHLTESKVLVPDDKTILKMDEVMMPIVEMIINNSVEIKNLSETRDSLLPRLMNGKIRVK